MITDIDLWPYLYLKLLYILVLLILFLFYLLRVRLPFCSGQVRKESFVWKAQLLKSYFSQVRPKPLQLDVPASYAQLRVFVFHHAWSLST